jgi:hypothetical protein
MKRPYNFVSLFAILQMFSIFSSPFVLADQPIQTKLEAESIVNQIISEYSPDTIKKFQMPLVSRIRWDEGLAPHLAPHNAPEIANGTATALDEQGNSVAIRNKRAQLLEVEIRLSSSFPTQLTSDGLAAIVCHEIGHFLGKRAKFGPWMKWLNADLVGMAIEGEADYFASRECLPRVFKKNFVELRNHNDSDTHKVQHLCSDRFVDSSKLEICQRVILAGHAMLRSINNSDAPTDLVKEGKNFKWVEISLDKKDRKFSLWTDWQHPSNQCRLDTFKKGALKKSRPACWKGLTLFRNV